MDNMKQLEPLMNQTLTEVLEGDLDMERIKILGKEVIGVLLSLVRV